MRIGIDISSAVDPRPTGVSRYIRRLVGELTRLPDAPELRLYCRPSRRRRGRPRELFDGRVRYWSDLRTPRRLDLWHSPDLRYPRGARCPVVVTIHDLSSLARDDHAPSRFRARKREGYARAARDAAAIITHSDAVRREVVESLGVEPSRVTAVPLAGGLERPKAVPPDRGGDRLLVIGGPSARKGSPRIHGLLSLWEEEFGWKPDVVWVGSATADETERFSETLAPAHRGRFDFRGHVTDDELDGLFATCRALLFLSDTEGFGMPLLEAAERGCPVLGIDSAPAREVLPQAHWFEDSPSSIRDATRRFLETADDASARERERRWAERFSWQRTAQETLMVYVRVASAGGQPAASATSHRRG